MQTGKCRNIRISHHHLRRRYGAKGNVRSACRPVRTLCNTVVVCCCVRKIASRQATDPIRFMYKFSVRYWINPCTKRLLHDKHGYCALFGGAWCRHQETELQRRNMSHQFSAVGAVVHVPNQQRRRR